MAEFNLHSPHHLRLIQQIDPYYGTDLVRPDNWSETDNYKLLSMIQTSDISRMKFNKLYRKVFPDGLPRLVPAASPPNSVSSSVNAQEGKNTLEVEVKVERGEGPDDAASNPSGGDTDWDSCIDLCVSDDEEDDDDDDDDSDRPFDSYTNCSPFNGLREYADGSLQECFLPNIEQTQIEMAIPNQDSVLRKYNPTWNLNTLQWSYIPDDVPPYYPYSQQLWLASFDPFPKCRFYHVIFNATHDLSAIWLDLPCGCLKKERSPWVGGGWIKCFYPIIWQRLLAISRKNGEASDRPFDPDCFVVQVPKSYSEHDQTRAEVWPIRSRWSTPTRPSQPSRKRKRRSGPLHSSKKSIKRGRKNKADIALQTMCSSWYDDAVPVNTFHT